MPDSLPGPLARSGAGAVLGGAFLAWACAELLLGLVSMAANWDGGVQLQADAAVDTVAAFGWFVGPVALLAAPAAALAGNVAHSPVLCRMSHAAMGVIAALLIGVAFGVESRFHLGVAAAIGAVSATVGSLGSPWASCGISRVSALGVFAVGLWLGAVAASA